MNASLIIELLAAALGVLGTVLLARKGPRAGWGFVAYLGSNVGWILFAWGHGHWLLLLQQLAFTAASLYGFWKWLLEPLFDSLSDGMDDDPPTVPSDWPKPDQGDR